MKIKTSDMMMSEVGNDGTYSARVYTDFSLFYKGKVVFLL